MCASNFNLHWICWAAVRRLHVLVGFVRYPTQNWDIQESKTSSDVDRPSNIFEQHWEIHNFRFFDVQAPQIAGHWPPGHHLILHSIITSAAPRRDSIQLPSTANCTQMPSDSRAKRLSSQTETESWKYFVYRTFGMILCACRASDFQSHEFQYISHSCIFSHHVDTIRFLCMHQTSFPTVQLIY